MTSAKTIEIQAPSLYPWQQQVRAALQTHRFVSVMAARQIGKTHYAVLASIEYAMQGGAVWWVAPNFSLTNPGFDLLSRLVKQQPFKQFVKPFVQRKLFVFRNGDREGTIEIKSADDPAQLVGATLDFAVLDEAARMHADAWFEGVYSTLTVRRGKALFITNPRGRNWMWEMWRCGFPDNPEYDPEYASFEFSQRENPAVTEADIERQRQQMPPAKFKREVMGQTSDDDGEVFIGVRAAANVPSGVTPIEGHSYVAGLDWGSSQDFTELAIIDETTLPRQQVACIRLLFTGFEKQWDDVERIYNAWNVRKLVVEENNIGNTNAAVLEKRGLNIERFNTNRYSKRPLFEDWALAIEKQHCWLLNDAELIKQHEALEATTTQHGTTIYSSTIHDDKVMASALAWRGVVGQRSLTPSLVRGTFTGLYGTSTGQRTYPTWQHRHPELPHS